MGGKDLSDSGSGYSTELLEFVRPLLRMQRDLLALGVEAYVEMPKIAVVGEQSSGKSSLLEMIIGFDCLPKSDELCTRRPLCLKLTNDDTAVEPEFFVGETLATMKKVPGPEALSAEILRLTDAVAGSRGLIVGREIAAEIRWCSCPELTLVDLPGIARNPLVGSDQPEDIEEVTKALIRSYVSRQGTIILAVIPAIVDPQASDALKVSRHFDPEGIRTVGVLTKTDMMGPGTDCSRTLEGRTVRVGKLGVVAMKCRSQRDVSVGKSVQQAIREEDAFFEAHPVYCHMDKSFFGTKQLSSKLMLLLAQHIKAQIPTLSHRLTSRLDSARDKISLLGRPINNYPAQVDVALDAVRAFSETFLAVTNGARTPGGPPLVGTAVMVHLQKNDCGARHLRQALLGFSASLAGEKRVGWSTFQEEDIKMHLAMSRDSALPGTVSFQAFEGLCRAHLEEIRKQAVDLVDEVRGNMITVANTLLDPASLQLGVEGDAGLPQHPEGQKDGAEEPTSKPAKLVVGSGIYRKQGPVCCPVHGSRNLSNVVCRPRLCKALHRVTVQMVDELAMMTMSAVSSLVESNGSIYTVDAEYRNLAEYNPVNVQAQSVGQPATGQGEAGVVTTGFGEFIEASSKIATTLGQEQSVGAHASLSLSTSDPEVAAVSRLKQRLVAYDKVVSRSLMDAVPRLVKHMLLDRLEVDMHKQLLKEVLTFKDTESVLKGGEPSDELSTGLSALLQESPEVEADRAALAREINVLSSAMKVLRDFI